MKLYPVSTIELSTGETMAYREAGVGPTVLLIHGNQSSSVHWAPLMERLENDYHVIAIDLMGFGDSSYHKRFDSLLDLAVHVDAFMAQKGIAAVPVIGWSTGGGVAMELAAVYPDRVSHLVLLSSVGLGGYPVFEIAADGQPDLTRRMCTKERIAEHPISVKPVLEAFAAGNREYMKMVWNMVIYQMKPVSDDDFEHYLDAMFKQRNLVDIVYALAMFNIKEESNGCAPGNRHVEQIKVPVTILQGRHDLVVPVAWAEEMKMVFADQATLRIVEQGGHSLLTDSLDDLETAIRGALS